MTCSTLGFNDSSDVFTRPAPQFNQHTVANATVHNEIYPPTAASPNPQPRAGNVTFYWSPAKSLGMPDHQITPDQPDTNPKQVLGASGAGVPYGRTGVAQMEWSVNSANLGFTGAPPPGIISGKLFGCASTDPIPDCPGIPATTAPGYYSMKSALYNISIPAAMATSAQMESSVESSEPLLTHEGMGLNLAFGIGIRGGRDRSVRVVARAIGRAIPSHNGFAYVNPDVEVGVSETSTEDPRRIFTGVLWNPEQRRRLELAPIRRDREHKFVLHPHQFLQAFIAVSLSRTERQVCLLEVLLIADEGNTISHFVAAVSNDSREPLLA